MIADVFKCLTVVVLAPHWVFGMNSKEPRYMRKEHNEKIELNAHGLEPDELRSLRDNEQVLATGVSSSGDISALRLKETAASQAELQAKLVAAATSKAQLRQNLADIDHLISKMEQDDVSEDGFIQKKLTPAQKKKHMKHFLSEMQRTNDDIRRRQKEEDAALHPLKKLENERKRHRKGHMDYYKEKMAKHKTRRMLKEAQKKARDAKYDDQDEADADEEASLLQEDHNPDGEEIRQAGDERLTREYVSGFDAKDRPHELRLDPANMKVYKFDTYKLRFPHKHDWTIETMWKKLPKAPHKVYRNTKKTDSMAASFLDEQQRPLVYVSDTKGYWHLGTRLTEEEIFKARYPEDFKRMMKEQLEGKNKPKALKEEERFKVYNNRTDRISELVEKYRNGDAVDQVTAHDRLIELRGKVRHELGLRELRHGRADVIVRGPAGNLCNFMVEVEKVNVGALRKQIEKQLDVPAEAQHLYIGGELMKDDSELLNKRLVAGHPHYIDLLQDGPKMFKYAQKRKAGQLKNQPANASEAAQSSAALVEATKEKVVQGEVSDDNKDFLVKHGHNESYTIPRPIDPYLAAWMAKRHEKLEKTSSLQEKPDLTPPKRRVLYVRDPTTHKIVVEKEEVGTALHPLTPDRGKYNIDGSLNQWHIVDRGIPLEALLEEEDVEHRQEEEQKKEAAVR
jgi:hypothetical protein